MPDIVTDQERDAVAKWLRRHKPKRCKPGESAFNFTAVWDSSRPGAERLVYKELQGMKAGERAALMRGTHVNRAASPEARAGLAAYHQRQRVAAGKRAAHVQGLRASGMSASAIAGKLGISLATVYKDLKGAPK